jgi:hypothetical protein
MGRLRASLSLLALLAVAATGLTACGSGGGDELLPGATANQIKSNLSQVERLVADGECVGAENSAAEINSQVEELTGIDARLKQALAEGAAKLTENVSSECVEEPEEEEATSTLEEGEEEEPEKKPKPEKPKKEEKEVEAEGETGEGPTLPPQSNGKGEEKGKGEENGQGEVPPVEPSEVESPPSGGVGPGVPAEGD